MRTLHLRTIVSVATVAITLIALFVAGALILLTTRMHEVTVDRLRIEQVITNLLSNAIKYSPEGGRVVVRLDREPGAAIVSVSDAGFGIAPDDQRRLFEPFTRLQNVGAAPGSGLGLYVVRRIVEAHGGSIVVESEPGMGRRFICGCRRTTNDELRMTNDVEPGMGLRELLDADPELMNGVATGLGGLNLAVIRESGGAAASQLKCDVLSNRCARQAIT